MSVPTITSTTGAASTTPVIGTPIASTTPTGLASTPTTLTSSNPSGVSTSVFSRVSNCFFKAFNPIRNCLSKLPLIGRFFMTEAQKITLADKKLAAQISSRFHPTYEAAYSSAGTFFPSSDEVEHNLDLFRQMRTPIAKMEVLRSILSAVNSSDDIARQFYENLPEEAQNGFKRQIWLDNHQRDNSHGFGYGDYIVNNEIRGPVAQQAAAHYITYLRFQN